MQSAQSTNIVPVESSRVIIVVGAELAVVTTAPDEGTRHPQLQPALSSAGTDKLNTLLPKSNFN